MNLRKWNEVKQDKVVYNKFGRGINIYDENEPIYIPVFTIEKENKNFIHSRFNNVYNTLLLFESFSNFEEVERNIKRVSRLRFGNLLLKHSNHIENYLELLILRKQYVDFPPKDKNFSKFDALLNSNNYLTKPFDNLMRFFYLLNKTSYEKHNEEVKHIY